MVIEFDQDRLEELVCMENEISSTDAIIGSILKWHPDNPERGEGLCCLCHKYVGCDECPLFEIQNNTCWSGSLYHEAKEGDDTLYNTLVSMLDNEVDSNE